MPHITGEFTVKLVPKTQNPTRTIPLFSQMTNDKEWSGNLVATSQGEMISTGTAVPNSAARAPSPKYINLRCWLFCPLARRDDAAGKHFYDLEYQFS